MTFGEFANVVRLAAARVRPALEGIAAGVAEGGEALAKGYIGQERAEWPPLASSTVDEKERLGFTGRISATDPLLRTGDMRDSIKGVFVATPVGVMAVIGSASPIARDQELGTSRIPPRPFLAMAMQEMEPVMVSRLETAAEGIFHPGIWTSEGYTPTGVKQ